MDNARTPPREAEHSRRGRRIYALALLVMGLGTLGSSWSGYQSSLWIGKQTFRLIEATGIGRRADLKGTEANQTRALDSALFVQYARSFSEGNRQLTRFLFDRMRPELREAITAWVATRPLKNPNAPSTPFVLPEYRIPAEAEARELLAQSEELHNQAQRANLSADGYALLTVLYSASLFLAGIIGGFSDRRVRRIIVGFSLTLLTAATLLLVRLPVAHQR